MRRTHSIAVPTLVVAILAFTTDLSPIGLDAQATERNQRNERGFKETCRRCGKRMYEPLRDLLRHRQVKEHIDRSVKRRVRRVLTTGTIVATLLGVTANHFYQQAHDDARTYGRAAQSVARVTLSVQEDGGRHKDTSYATVVRVRVGDQTHDITADHFAEDWSPKHEMLVSIGDGQRTRAKVAWRDPAFDLAGLTLADAKLRLPALPIGAPTVGQEAAVIGYGNYPMYGKGKERITRFGISDVDSLMITDSGADGIVPGASGGAIVGIERSLFELRARPVYLGQVSRIAFLSKGRDGESVRARLVEDSVKRAHQGLLNDEGIIIRRATGLQLALPSEGDTTAIQNAETFQQLRRKLRLPPLDVDGPAVVTSVNRAGPASEVLQPGDVVLYYWTHDSTKQSSGRVKAEPRLPKPAVPRALEVDVALSPAEGDHQIRALVWRNGRPIELKLPFTTQDHLNDRWLGQSLGLVVKRIAVPENVQQAEKDAEPAELPQFGLGVQALAGTESGHQLGLLPGDIIVGVKVDVMHKMATPMGSMVSLAPQDITTANVRGLIAALSGSAQHLQKGAKIHSFRVLRHDEAGGTWTLTEAKPEAEQGRAALEAFGAQIMVKEDASQEQTDSEA